MNVILFTRFTFHPKFSPFVLFLLMCFMAYICREVDELRTELRKYLNCSQAASDSVRIADALVKDVVVEIA